MDESSAKVDYTIERGEGLQTEATYEALVAVLRAAEAVLTTPMQTHCCSQCGICDILNNGHDEDCPLVALQTATEEARKAVGTGEGEGDE